MVDIEICKQPEERDDWHTRWLTMQSAYAEYRRSSEALECTRQTPDDSLATEQVRLTMLEGQQRLAFERYIDARIAFLESRFDEVNRPDGVPGAAPGAPAAADGNMEESKVKAWLSIASSRPALQTLAVMLLCTTALSLMRQQTRIRNLETERDELRSALLRTGHEVQQLRDRLDNSSPSSPLSKHIQKAPAAPEPLQPFMVPKRAKRHVPAQRNVAQQEPSRQAAKASRTPASIPASRRLEGRAISVFSLSPSREFKRVGPLAVLVRSIDHRKGTADLSIVSDTTQVDVQHLRLNQPVWLNLAHRDHRIGLVANRMTANRIEGRLVEAESSKPDLSASRMRPKYDSTP